MDVCKDITIKMPQELAELAKNGQIVIQGVARDSATGRILKHLPVVESAPKEMAKGFASVTNTAKSQGMGRGAVITGAVVTGTLVVGSIAATAFFVHKKRQTKALTQELQNEISTYINGVQEGVLKIEDLRKFTNFIGDITKDIDCGKIKIALSVEELSALRSVVVKVTKEIIKQHGNNAYISAIATCSDPIGPNAMLVNIHENLIFQQDILAPVKVISEKNVTFKS